MVHESLNQLSADFERLLTPQRAANATALALAAYRRLPDAELAELDLDQVRDRIITALEVFESGSAAQPTIRIETVDGTTRLYVHVIDGPFVLSTITEELHRLGLDPVDLGHPAVGVERDDSGALKSIVAARHADSRETYLAMDLQAELDQDAQDYVVLHIRQVLDDALHAVEDFEAMRYQVSALVDEVAGRAMLAYDVDTVEEVGAFLRWLQDDHFVFLGYRGYDVADGAVRVTPGSGLGILHDEEHSDYASWVPLTELPPPLQRQLTKGELLSVARTARHSTVHRQVRMIDVSVQRVDDDGALVGQHRMLGLLAQKAFVEPSSTIPVLRQKLAAILDAEDVIDHSQDERALRTLFDAFPKQELFESGVDELRHSLVGLLDVGHRNDVRVMIRTERSGSSVSVLVTVPRERFSADLRVAIQALLSERVGAHSVDYQLSMTERDQPLLHFALALTDPANPPRVDVDELQRDIAILTRTFEDELIDALSQQRDLAAARQAGEEWCAALPAVYTETTSVELAVIDIGELEQLDGPTAVRMRLVAQRPPVASTADGGGRKPVGSSHNVLRFRLYKAGPGVELSGFIPLLESLGLVVIEEQPYVLRSSPIGEEAHIHDYGVRCDITQVDVDSDGPRLAAAATAMWHGSAEVDSLNRLIVLAGMSIDEVTILRAYRRYLRQIGTNYTEVTTNDALLEHPLVARALLDYFDVRFDPDYDGPRDSDTEAARKVVRRELDQITRLDQDRIMRSFLGVIDATLRTNRWQGHPWISFKFDSAAVPGVPKPVPYREIFVYSPQMEGVHLRGGPVARGGLRWSDRMDDFRTEVLGLMKAQMSKNAVIVPTGSKGGYVLKNRPVDPTALRQEVEAQYRVFIRGLLDLTDNIVSGVVTGPPRVVRTDGDDPYLVVAADRGTATFSDVANSISAEYDFWLDDAFASGGSQGYDHKAMGITARGAWVAVQRHFRELGVDVQTEPFTVAGVGDMSGDVFGNGMLRSPTIRLVAAFDHRDIFIDPDPIPDQAFAERERLFGMPRSSWQDYSRELISDGGGVWSRTAKSIPLSAQAQRALRVEAEEMSPPDLLHAILSAPVDLLWFGGIGTYVKSAEESHSDVGDRANDAVRVNADEVAARVVGEGGNLAMTQRGRIVYGRRGGRCNTDAVDNVAGVNTSDREVNMKILLRLAIENGQLPADERDVLLESLTADIADQVLRDSYLQTWTVSQEMNSAPGGMGGYEMLMSRLEERGRLDRVVEVLPSTAEVEQRDSQGAGMTRAEVCVLVAYAKIDLTERLLESSVIDQPAFDPVRREYFPGPIASQFGDLTSQHRLRRELVATVVAGDLVNRLGVTWATRTAVDLGVDVPQVVAAYWIARQIIGADQRWRSVEALDGRADPVLQFELKSSIDWLVDAYTRSYIRLGRMDDITGAIADDAEPFRELAQRADAATTRSPESAIRQAVERWIGLGIDEDLAEQIAALPALTLVPGIALTSRHSGRTVVDSGQVYELLAERLPLGQMNSRLREYQAHDRWERGQHRGLVDDLRRLHHTVSRQAISSADPAATPEQVVQQFLAERAETVHRAVGLARQVHSQPEPDLNALAVAVRALSEISS
ncbi:MAG: NAD-glutamate dehydrogenase [Euzebya sp.]